MQPLESHRSRNFEREQRARLERPFSAASCACAALSESTLSAHPSRRSSRQTLGVFALLVQLCALLFSSAAAAEPPCVSYTKWREQGGVGGACPRPLNSESARGLALGTGVRATAMSTSALAYNPASLVVGKSYHIEGMVDYMPDMKTVALGGAVVDSSTSTLAAGLSLRGFLSGQDGVGGIDGRLGLAFPISEGVSIGIAGRYINAKRDLPALSLMDAASGGEPMPLAAPESARTVKGFTMDASIRVSPTPAVMLYGASYNLINLDSVYAPLLVGGGLGIGLGSVALVGADLLVDLTSYEKANPLFGAGAEVFAGQAVPIRAGYSYDTKRKQHTLTLGLGYTDRSVGLDLSLRQDLGGEGDTRVMGAFRFYVH